MDISQYLRIANTTGVDANARIDLNAEGTVSAVGTSKVGRLGERIVRNAADARHYTQVRQNFLDSLKTLYGVKDQSQLPKMVLDAFKDEEVVCGKPLTKRRIVSVLDAVRRNLDYTSLNALEHGVAEHVKTFGDKVDVDNGGIDLDDESRTSFYADSEDGEEVEVAQEEEKEANPFLEDFEVVDYPEAGPSLQERIRANASIVQPQDRDRFAANISGKFIGKAADQLMERFDKFMKICDHCLDNAGVASNYATDWLLKMRQALTTARRGNNVFANQNVVRPMGTNQDSIFISEKELKEDYDVKPDTYTLDEAIAILQKWEVPGQPVPETESKDLGEDDDDYDNKSEFNEDVAPGDGFDLETEKPVFSMDVALSFKDPKLTKKVMEGAKRFETQLRAEAKAQKFGKQRTQAYVDKGMEFFMGKSFNRTLGELWSVDHQRLENPANTEEFEKEMRNIRMYL